MGGIFSTVEPAKTPCRRGADRIFYGRGSPQLSPKNERKTFSIDNPNSGGRFFAHRSFFNQNEVTEGNVGEHILRRLHRATVELRI